MVVTISAYGATIDCQGQGRGVSITNGAVVTVYGLTVMNGLTSGAEIGEGYGGGFLAQSSTVTLIDVTLATSTSALGYGGGCLCGLSSVVTLRSCVVTGCYSGDVGGNVYHYLGNFTMTDSTVTYGVQTNNVLGGGGITFKSTTVIITDSSVSYNSAINLGDGGGLHMSYCTATMDNVTVVGNYQDDTSEDFGGAGVYLYTCTTTITNSYIASNTGRCSGGGITADTGTVYIIDTEIFNNTVAAHGGGIAVHADVYLTNVLIHGNTAGKGGGLFLYEDVTLVAVNSAVCQNLALPTTSAPNNVFCKDTAVSEGLANGCGLPESCGFGAAACSLNRSAESCVSCLGIAWAGANCSICAPGYYLDESSSACKACAAGTHLSFVNSRDSCDWCPPGTYGPGSNASSCAPCGSGTFASDSGARTMCGVCPANTYTPEAGATSCVACPVGAACLGAVVQAMPGYYEFPGYHFGACLPGYCLGANQCAAYRTGPLCGLCIDGYVNVKGVCTLCDTGISWSAVLGMVALNLFFVVYALYFQAITHARVGILTFLGQTTSIMLANTIVLPTALKSVFAVSALVPGVNCLAPLSFYGQFALALAAPLFPVVIIGLCFVLEVVCWQPLVRVCKWNVARLSRYTNQSEFPDRYFQALWSEMLFTFLPLARVLLSAQSCSAPYAGTQQLLLVDDSSVECRDEHGLWNVKYLAYRSVSIALLASYVYLMPLGLSGLVEFLRRRRDLKSQRVRGRFGVLYLAYASRMPWFEGCIQARKVAVATIITFAPSIDSARIALAGVFAFLLFLHYNARPYHYSGDNALEAVSLLVLLGLSIMLCSHWFNTAANDNAQTALIAMVCVCGFFVTVAGAWVFIGAYWQRFCGAWKRRMSVSPSTAVPADEREADESSGVEMVDTVTTSSVPRLQASLGKKSAAKELKTARAAMKSMAAEEEEDDERPKSLASTMKSPRPLRSGRSGKKRASIASAGDELRSVPVVPVRRTSKSTKGEELRRESPPMVSMQDEDVRETAPNDAKGLSIMPRPASMPVINPVDLPNVVAADSDSAARARARKARALRPQASLAKIALGAATLRDSTDTLNQYNSRDVLLDQ